MYRTKREIKKRGSGVYRCHPSPKIHSHPIYTHTPFFLSDPDGSSQLNIKIKNKKNPMSDGVGESHRFPPIDGLHDRCCNISNERCRRAPLEFIKSPSPRCLSAKPASAFSSELSLHTYVLELLIYKDVIPRELFDIQIKVRVKSPSYTAYSLCSCACDICLIASSPSVNEALLMIRFTCLDLHGYIDTCWDVSSWPFANVNTGLYRGILTCTNFIYTSQFGKSQSISSASKPSPNMFFSFVLGK